jgi:acyl-CoA reductase-like NAD-dependent aldehyde dehydrogenase
MVRGNTCRPTDRGLLYKPGDLILKHSDVLIEVESRHNGKLRSEAGGQVRYMAKYFYYYGGLADEIRGAVIPMDKPKVFNYTRYEPLGVVAANAPWNSSLLLTA